VHIVLLEYRRHPPAAAGRTLCENVRRRAPPLDVASSCIFLAYLVCKTEKGSRLAAGREIRRRGEGRSRVYDLLFQETLSLRLEPGSALDEAELAETYGVSRTPMREAIIRLSGEGLVRLRPNRSARVAPMDVHNLREYHEAAELMHRVVARWAAARRSDA